MSWGGVWCVWSGPGSGAPQRRRWRRGVPTAAASPRKSLLLDSYKNKSHKYERFVALVVVREVVPMSKTAVVSRFPVLSLEEQANFVAGIGLDTLLFCPNGWALRHRFINTNTGETVRARCGSWSCLYCGPRKVDQWRQLVKAAEPTLFVTLTKVGTTLKEAARTLTTVLQYLRRGSKGRGKAHVGARPAYPLQVFAVLEEHSDFEENGFHWHLLVKGVDYLPNQVVSEALRSATGGRSYITRVKRVKNNRAVGYVTKYLTKEIMRERRGLVEEEKMITRVAVKAVEGRVDAQGKPYCFETCYDEQGQIVMEEERRVVQRLCKAHRIRYSKQFFPTSTAELRWQLFGEKREQEEEEQREEEGQEQGEEEQGQECKAWVLHEVESLDGSDRDGRKRGHEVLLERKLRGENGEDEDEEREEGEGERRAQQYRRLRRDALLESVQALREGRWMYSRRIIGIWSYQRERLRVAG